MDKHFIEKPKKPVCLETGNLVLTIVTLILLFFLEILLFFIFLVAMAAFFVVTINEYRNAPEAILYTKGHKLCYYKRVLTEIKFKDIIEVKVTHDKKDKPYIDINYKDEKDVPQQILIDNKNAEEIVSGINEILETAKLELKK